MASKVDVHRCGSHVPQAVPRGNRRPVVTYHDCCSLTSNTFGY